MVIKKQDYSEFKKRKVNVISSFFLIMLIVLLSSIDAKKVRIEKIEFQGNSTFNDKVLLNLISSKESSLFKKHYFSPFTLSDDVNALTYFYQNQGFIKPEIKNSVIRNRKHDEIRIVFSISEGPRVSIGSILITPNLVLDTMHVKLKSKKGDPFKMQQTIADASTLQDSIAAKGYLKGAVKPEVIIDSISYKAFITFNVNLGPKIRVSEIYVDGLKLVHSGVVERELEFKKGSILTSKEIKETEQNLFQTQAFNFLTIEPQIKDSLDQLTSGDTAVPVRISVSEAKFLTVGAGIGYSAYERLTLSLSTTYNNLFKRLHTVSFSANASDIEQRVEIAYGMPYVFNIPLSFIISAYYDRRGNLFFDVPLPFTGNFNGFTVSIGQNRMRYLSYQLQLQWENTINVNTPNPDTIAAVSDKNTRSIIGSIIFDKRNDIFYPTKGIVNQTSGEIAGFGGGTNKFIKIVNDFKTYIPIGKRMNLASAVTFGYAVPYGSSELLPVQDQFYAGGPRSVRGYDLDFLITDAEGNPAGGNVELLFHLFEFQFPIVWILWGAVFSDAGYIWNDLRSVDLRNIKYTAGPGLRLVTPIGVIRYDIGFKLDQLGRRGSYKMYLDIGRAF